MFLAENWGEVPVLFNASIIKQGMSSETPSPEIDFDHLNLYVGHDPDLTREIFGLFRNQVDIWRKALVPDADDEVWAAVTHSFKGSARAVGAMGLAEACERAEQLVGEGKRPGSREVSVVNIENRIEQVLLEIQRWEYHQNMKDLKA